MLVAIITGPEHNGTTYLKNLLDSHPEIFSGFETGILMHDDFEKCLPFYNWVRGEGYHWGLPQTMNHGTDYQTKFYVLKMFFVNHYISPLQEKSDKFKFGHDGSGYRTKSAFIKKPTDKHCDKMEKLYKIRPHRKITEQDMKNIWPDWNYKTD